MNFLKKDAGSITIPDVTADGFLTLNRTDFKEYQHYNSIYQKRKEDAHVQGISICKANNKMLKSKAGNKRIRYEDYLLHCKEIDAIGKYPVKDNNDLGDYDLWKYESD